MHFVIFILVVYSITIISFWFCKVYLPFFELCALVICIQIFPACLTSLLNLCYILNAACAVALFLCKHLGMFQIPYGPSYYRATEPSDACNMSGYFENRNCIINNVCYRWLNLRLIFTSKNLRNELKDLTIAHVLIIWDRSETTVWD